MDFDASVEFWYQKWPDDQWMGRLLSFGVSPGDRVLDAGCGAGSYAAALALAGMDVVGVDNDSQMITLARSTPPASCVFHKADLANLPSEFRGFKWALLRCVLHNAPRSSWTTIISSVSRSLVPTGSIIIETSEPSQVVTHFDCDIYPPLRLIAESIYPTFEEIASILDSLQLKITRVDRFFRKAEQYRTVSSALEDSHRLVLDGRGPYSWRMMSLAQRREFHRQREIHLPERFPTGLVPRQWPSTIIAARVSLVASQRLEL